MTETSPHMKYRLNEPKPNENNKAVETQHYTIIKNKENIVRINKISRKNSGS
jgi:hypothetical protein